MKDFKNKNILFITHTYSSFEKAQVDYLSNFFNEVYVIVRYKPIAELSRIFPLTGAKNHTYAVSFNLKNKPDNVKVFCMALWYLPFDVFYKQLGEYAFKEADRIIKKYDLKFDLIFSFFFWTSGYVGNKIKEKYNIPHVTSGRGGDVYDHPFRSEFWKNKTLDVVNNADIVTTVSKENASCLKILGFNKEVVIIPNGFFSSKSFPLKMKDVRSQLSLPIDKKIILTVGYLGEIKGQKYLIDAMAKVKEKYPDVLCLIIGEGELKKKLETQIKTLGLQENVNLLGYKKNEEINEWINATDIFVLASLGEGYPNVMNECLACGKPFIGSRVGAIPDIISDDNIGYLCEPKNSEDLAEKIVSALPKKWDAEYIINFAQKLNYDYVAKQYLEIFEKLIV